MLGSFCKWVDPVLLLCDRLNEQCCSSLWSTSMKAKRWMQKTLGKWSSSFKARARIAILYGRYICLWCSLHKMQSHQILQWSQIIKLGAFTSSYAMDHWQCNANGSNSQCYICLGRSQESTSATIGWLSCSAMVTMLLHFATICLEWGLDHLVAPPQCNTLFCRRAPSLLFCGQDCM